MGKLKVKYQEVEVEIVLFDAETAQQFLDDANIGNRKWAKTISDRYADFMLEGNWHETGEPIIVDRFGILRNGQHRLHALIIAEKRRLANEKHYAEQGIKKPLAYQFVLVKGIHEDAVNFLDTGKVRNQSDMVFVNGLFPVSENGHTSSAAKKLSTWYATAAKILCFRLDFADLPRSTRKFSNSMLEGVIDNYPGLKEVINHIDDLETSHEKALSRKINPAYLAAFAYIAGHSGKNDTLELAKDDSDDGDGLYGSKWKNVQKFMKLLATGADMGEDHPVLILREWLEATRGKRDGDHLWVVLLKTWKAFLAGDSVGKKERETMLSETNDPTWLGGIDVEPKMDYFWTVKGVQYSQEEFEDTFGYDPTNEPDWKKVAEQKQAEKEAAKKEREKEKAEKAAAKEKEKKEKEKEAAKAAKEKAKEKKASKKDKSKGKKKVKKTKDDEAGAMEPAGPEDMDE